MNTYAVQCKAKVSVKNNSESSKTKNIKLIWNALEKQEAA